MSVKRITATIDCDHCGSRFTIEIDEASSKSGRVGRWSMFDIVEDSLRNGLNFLEYIPPRKPFDKPQFTGMYHDQHLCPDCNSKTAAEREAEKDEL